MSVEVRRPRACGFSLCLLLTLGVASVAWADAVPGRIGFVGKNAIAKANGTFRSWKLVEVSVDPANLATGSVEVEIDVASLDTDNQRRDDHLRSADFFEVERWPTARIRVHSASPLEGAHYEAKFDVEIRDAKRTLVGTFEVIDRERLEVRGQVTLDRMAFGIGEPETWNPLSITEAIPITFEAKLR